MTQNSKLKTLNSIYFIGIGGIGMSALARFFKKRGAKVAGYDKTETDLTKNLVKEGIAVHYEEDVEQIPKDLDLVVWTPAIPAEHKELQWFRANGFELKKRAEVLGMISKSHRLVGIAGTHGKTTTSCMTTHFLQFGGVDCSAFLGGIAVNYKNNYIEGESDWVVAEADEYDRSFLQLYPEIAVLNAIDPDHLDIYGSAEEVKRTYEQYARQLQKDGLLLYKTGLDLENVAEELRKSDRRVATFGIDSGDYQASNLRVENGYQVFDFSWGNEKLKGVKLRFAGRHNVENASAALAVAINCGVPKNKLKRAVSTFKGVKRRFEYIIRRPELVFINDYAHHPEELKAVISAVQNFYSDKKITGVFQPHLFSRTRDFSTEFAQALDLLDECVLLDIYPAREKPIEGITSETISKQMKLKNKQLASKNTLISLLKNRKIEVLLTMGAGDIDDLVKPISKAIGGKG